MAIYKDVLMQIGLNEKEALVYEALLETGMVTAGTLIKKTGLKRGNLYDILHALIKKDLAESVTEKDVSHFRANSPKHLNALLTRKTAELSSAQQGLDRVFANLKSLYTVTTKKPAVSYFEGVAGLARIHEDIIKTGQQNYVFRSSLDRKEADFYALLRAHLRNRVAAGIHTKVLTPILDNTTKSIQEDAANLVERRVIPKDQFLLPAQIIVYGNKVAITEIKETFISTLIEDKNIAATFLTLFQYIWEHAAQEDTDFRKNISAIL